MKLIRLTQENVSKYMGYEILFKSRGNHLVKKIIGINKSSVKIDHPDLNNQLEIVSRKIYIIIE